MLEPRRPYFSYSRISFICAVMDLTELELKLEPVVAAAAAAVFC